MNDFNLKANSKKCKSFFAVKVDNHVKGVTDVGSKW